MIAHVLRTPPLSRIAARPVLCTRLRYVRDRFTRPLSDAVRLRMTVLTALVAWTGLILQFVLSMRDLLGYGHVLTNTAAIVAGLLCIGCALVGLDRRLGRGVVRLDTAANAWLPTPPPVPSSVA